MIPAVLAANHMLMSPEISVNDDAIFVRLICIQPSELLCITSRGVTEFEFDCCRNPTIFPHPNPSNVQREFWWNSNLVLC